MAGLKQPLWQTLDSRQLHFAKQVPYEETVIINKKNKIIVIIIIITMITTTIYSRMGEIR